MSQAGSSNRNYHDCHWVQVATCDGLRLDGLLHDPTWDAGEKATQRDASVVLLLHGAGANFYGPSLINRVGTHLFRAGWPVLRVNNRGHDGWHVAFRGGKMTQMGAAFERLEESVWDVQAWVGWLQRNGYSRVILAGHSLGAFKGVYALSQAAEACSAVEAAVAISPPCLSESLFAGSARGELFRETVERCRTWEAEGRGQEVFAAQYPFPMLISAGCYLNKYASGERFNFTHWHQTLSPPLLWIYGGGELATHEALARGIEGLERSLPASQSLVTIPEADHFFTGWSREVCVAVEQWLESYR